jgi:hypothetical protein
MEKAAQMRETMVARLQEAQADDAMGKISAPVGTAASATDAVHTPVHARS